MKREYSDRQLYRLLLRQARPCWALLGAQFVVSSLSTPIALLIPVPLKIVVDSVIGSHPLPRWLDVLLPGATRSTTALTVAVCLLFVVISLLDQLQRLGASLLRTYTGERLTLDLRARLFRHVQRLSLSFHDMRGTADSVYRIQYDATSISQVLIYGVTPLLTSGLTILGMMYVTARLDWVLALAAMTVTPVVIGITLQGRRLLRDGWHRAKNLDSTALSVVQEVLTGLRIVQAFGQEDREHGRYVGHAGKTMRSRVRITFIDGLFGVGVGLTTAIGTAIVLYIGVSHVQQGVLTLGDLVLVMAYLAQLYVPIQLISKSVTDLQSALASAERAFGLLEEKSDVPERRQARHLGRATGSIEFRHVSFSYHADSPVLTDVSFELSPGSRLGISGTTGAGKTTLVNMLMRFYDPTQGKILLDGVDLRDYRLADLRNQFGMVLQEPVLFSTSITDNIAYARPRASRDEIVQAAVAANAHQFIAKLPDGYETLVGERGMRLSGGERQRVAIARAFLKDAPILVLDEPTSAVDVETESVMIEAMEHLMEGRTTLMIAHRLSTLNHCDVRLEVNNGHVARSDTRLLQIAQNGQPRS
jgi:ATP-binding cassette subfamily B protein